MADRYRRLASAAQRMVEQGGGGQVEPVDFGTEETHALWQRLQALLEQMREQEQRALTARRDLQAVLDAATEVAIIATDSAGIIRLFNRGASKLLGWPAEAVVGSESVLRLHDPEELRARAEALREAGIPVPAVEPAAALTAVARSSGYEVRDWTCRRRDGSPLLVSMAVTALRDADGEPSGFLHIAIDQSSRQRALELEVERERAEAASRAKSDFLSRVSHELRTPLNAMLGYAQLMELDPTDPLSARQHERVSRIETAGWHLLKLIDDVLDLSRIEAGNLPLVTQAVELDEALRQALRLVAPQAEQHRVHLQAWDPPAGGPLRVQADPTRLTQVLVNLLSNAVKYNRPEGKVWVQARTTDAGEVAIQVYDTGRGIALERQSRLFAPFDRIGMENSGVPGTGLGLVITKRLVELMQGRIDVQSTPDEGSCFTVVLPLAHERSGAPAARALPPAASSEQPAVARDIVYVEDNPMNAALMREVLALRPGWRLHLSESCREGQALIERVQPQLVLVDVHLPDGNGQALIRWLRSHPRLHALPAVIVSADATEAQQEAGLGAGATAYLTKPVRIDTALQTLDALLTDAPPRPGGG
jgi:PAS domain S-box-containing protein